MSDLEVLPFRSVVTSTMPCAVFGLVAAITQDCPPHRIGEAFPVTDARSSKLIEPPTGATKVTLSSPKLPDIGKAKAPTTPRDLEPSAVAWADACAAAET